MFPHQDFSCAKIYRRGGRGNHFFLARFWRRFGPRAICRGCPRVLLFHPSHFSIPKSRYISYLLLIRGNLRSGKASFKFCLCDHSNAFFEVRLLINNDMNNIKHDHRVIIRSEQKIAGTFNKEVEVSSSVKKTIITQRNSCFHGQRCENFTLLANPDQTLVFAISSEDFQTASFINIY
jgi:hypothetical protein